MSPKVSGYTLCTQTQSYTLTSTNKYTFTYERYTYTKHLTLWSTQRKQSSKTHTKKVQPNKVDDI